MKELYLASGVRVPLGNQLGKGGEGAVYEVPTLNSELVAKVYHQSLSSEKQAKLHGMFQCNDKDLQSFSTWPIEPLYQAVNGAIRGFLMRKVTGYEPIHHLYGPAHRKQSFPEMGWNFLIYAARNLANAFEAIHSRGHVIGDVNQGNILVTKSSFIKLIDCDSFQITTAGKCYPCEVGIGHFTPPELQGQSFRGVQRTRNHDNFGLAILLFHLLMMGRHPFAGIYSGTGDMSVEKAIREFRFAYAANAKSKNMSPPPNTPTLSIVPQTLLLLFERAFSESGVNIARPTASEWRVALDELKNQLCACRQEPMHKYYVGLSSCPWCDFEQRSIFFFLPNSLVKTNANNFNLERVWAGIMEILSPGPAPRITPSSFKVIPKPIPSELLGIIGFFRFEKQKEERQVRQNALTHAKQYYMAINKQWQNDAGDARFISVQKELTNLRKEYENLNNSYAQEHQILQNTIRERQLKRYLDTFFIEERNIPSIGTARKQILASYGIETAADIDLKK